MAVKMIAPKSIEQQDLQGLHRIRSRLIGSRTQLGNQIVNPLDSWLRRATISSATPVVAQSGQVRD